MKRFIIPLLIVCVAGLVTFEITSRYRCSTESVTLDCLNNTGWLAGKLALDKTQIGKITKLQAEFRTKLEACNTTHCGACCKLSASLFGSNGKDDETTTLIEQMSLAQKESELITIKHIRQVHDLLNPEQKKQFEKMVKVCIGACKSNSECAKSCERR